MAVIFGLLNTEVKRLLTYNDLDEVVKQNNQKAIMDFVLKAIKQHKETDAYKIGNGKSF